MTRKQPNDYARFPTTRWSFVAKAAEGGAENDAFVLFLRQYLPALQAYLTRVHRLSPDSADDLLQEFVLEKVIRQQLIAHADQRRGRFRAFLLCVLNNFLMTQRRKAVTARRSPGHVPVPLNETTAQLADEEMAADVFDREWARQLLVETVRRFEAACQSAGRPELWEVFNVRVLAPVQDGVEPMPYDQLVCQFGFKSPAQASNALTTAKRWFARELRIMVGEYARDQREIQDEISHLRRILAAKIR